MKLLIVDVREPGEFASDHVKGSINVPLGDLLAGAPQLKSIDKDTEVIVYCRTGSRSRIAEQALRNQGFTNVVNGINQEHVQSEYGLSADQ